MCNSIWECIPEGDGYIATFTKAGATETKAKVSINITEQVGFKMTNDVAVT